MPTNQKIYLHSAKNNIRYPMWKIKPIFVFKHSSNVIYKNSVQSQTAQAVSRELRYNETSLVRDFKKTLTCFNALLWTNGYST